MTTRPEPHLRSFKLRLEECLTFVRRMKVQEPAARREDASHDKRFQVADKEYDDLFKLVGEFLRGSGSSQNAIDPHAYLRGRIKANGYEPKWWTSAENTYCWLLEWTEASIAQVASIK